MKSYVPIVAVLTGLVCPSALEAGNLGAPCAPNTLAFYQSSFNTNRECSVGILDFMGFSFTAAGTGDAALLNASEIFVTPVADGPLGGGFTLSAVDPVNDPFAVRANQSATYFIDWFFVIDPAPMGISASLETDPSSGSVSITQAYCVDGITDGRDSCMPGFQTLSVSSPPCVDPVNHPETCSASLTFRPPVQNFADVETTIILTSGSNSGAEFDSLSGGVDVLSTSGTPEPSTLMLSFGGLMTAALSWKRMYQICAAIRTWPGLF
jgi:hypothetical protein